MFDTDKGFTGAAISLGVFRQMRQKALLRPWRSTHQIVIHPGRGADACERCERAEPRSKSAAGIFSMAELSAHPGLASTGMRIFVSALSVILMEILMERHSAFPPVSRAAGWPVWR